MRRPVTTERQRAVVLLRELLEGKSHTRQTIAELLGVSLRTADRWMKIFERLPGIQRAKGRPMLTYARAGGDSAAETLDRAKRKIVVGRSAELDAVLDAVWRSRILRFAYREGKGPVRGFRVQPLSVVVDGGRVFLLARESSAEDPFPFLVASMSEVVVETAGFEYPSRAEYDPSALVAPSFLARTVEDDAGGADHDADERAPSPGKMGVRALAGGGERNR